jgi:hypothetical protein
MKTHEPDTEWHDTDCIFCLIDRLADYLTN